MLISILNDRLMMSKLKLDHLELLIREPTPSVNSKQMVGRVGMGGARVAAAREKNPEKHTLTCARVNVNWDWLKTIHHAILPV